MKNSKDYIEIKKSGLFDYKFYKETYKGIIGEDIDLIEHYLLDGVKMLLDPSKNFSTQGYLSCYGDVARAKMNPLVHYVKRGKLEGRSPMGITIKSNNFKYPRFGFSEYGRVDFQIKYDENVLLETSDLKICVHVHLFHLDLMKLFKSYLSNITTNYTLLVSICDDKEKEVERYFIDNLKFVNKCVVKKFENKGRDVAPWVIGFADEILNYDIFLHLHSKKSDYNSNYSGWRKFLLHHVIGSKSIVNSILNKFILDKSAGLIYPPYFGALPSQPKWGANKNNVINLLEQLNLNLPVSDVCHDFPSGSFFWSRVECLKGLLLLGKSRKLVFEDEFGQLDGTLGHAIERVLTLLPKACRMDSLCCGIDVGYNLINYWDHSRSAAVVKPSEQLTRNSNKININIDIELSLAKIAVCYCVTGGFEEIVDIPIIESGIDYFLVTDSLTLEVPQPYKKLYTGYIDSNPRRTARFVKTHPHFYFKNYDYVIWIDSNIVPIVPMSKYIKMLINSGKEIGLIAHPIRNSYLLESEECIKINADAKDVILEQMEHYKRLGIKEEHLIETNIIVSQPKLERTKLFFNEWWNEITKYSYRDQISICKVMQSMSLDYLNILNFGDSVRDSGDFVVFAHGVVNRQEILNRYLLTFKWMGWP